MNLNKIVKTTVFTTLCSAAALSMADIPSTPIDVDMSDFSMYGVHLSTMDRIRDALNSGAVVNATVDLTQCARQGGGDPSETKGGLRVSPYRITGDGSLSFSDSHFTVSTRSGSPVPIMQYLRYSAAPEGDITLTSYIYSIPDYNLISESAFDCAINKGIDFYAAF